MCYIAMALQDQIWNQLGLTSPVKLRQTASQKIFNSFELSYNSFKQINKRPVSCFDLEKQECR